MLEFLSIDTEHKYKKFYNNSPCCLNKCLIVGLTKNILSFNTILTFKFDIKKINSSIVKMDFALNIWSYFEILIFHENFCFEKPRKKNLNIIYFKYYIVYLYESFS